MPALADYSEVIRLNPGAAAFINRGVAHDRQGDFASAIQDYDAAIRLNARYAVAFADRGESYRKKGNLTQAIADTTEAIRIDGNSSLAYLNRGNAYLDKADFDHAIQDYTEVLERSPRPIPTTREGRPIRPSTIRNALPPILPKPPGSMAPSLPLRTPWPGCCQPAATPGCAMASRPSRRPRAPASSPTGRTPVSLTPWPRLMRRPGPSTPP